MHAVDDVRAAIHAWQDDAKGQVHSSWTPNLGTPHLRLTDRSAALSSRPKPGSGGGYYYAATPTEQYSLPVAPPQKIGADELAPQQQAPPAQEGKASSNYYYAHRRKIDFHVPTPPPQKLA